ncbi:hypothetical protein G7061_08325 [Erysipelothrix sp. HDW6B]|uniref:hypothetical protein n=1 Tax=Erysipelothrix sp. HDW6B TaxID=2714929 RepID=UPI00140D9AEA|nr:hypothetical protein [Erysipelothrix sp. HDW6B]QIK86613.1 hypothetical protein G7061_08325 [Erysipelothrix sp. HDW6B]
MFTDKEKVMMFDEISRNYFERNFGSMTKANFELLLFKFYYEKLVESSIEPDGKNFFKFSDYEISKVLGITQSRVRNLKERKELVYPTDYDWISDFTNLMHNVRYDDNSYMAIVNIPDPNLFIEIRNYIENIGGYVDFRLNKNILKIRVEYLLEIVYLMHEDMQDAIIEEIEKSFSIHDIRIDKDLNFVEMVSPLVKHGVEIVALLANIATIVG